MHIHWFILLFFSFHAQFGFTQAYGYMQTEKNKKILSFAIHYQSNYKENNRSANSLLKNETSYFAKVHQTKNGETSISRLKFDLTGYRNNPPVKSVVFCPCPVDAYANTEKVDPEERQARIEASHQNRRNRHHRNYGGVEALFRFAGGILGAIF